MKQCNIIWFRRDLRISDNEIVAQAAVNGQPSLFIFTIDPWFFQQAEIGAMRVKFLLESLIALDQSLRTHGARLTILAGESVAVLQELLRHCQVHGYQPTLYFNRDVQVEYGLQRDAAMRQFCQRQNIHCHEGLSYILVDDAAIWNNWRNAYHEYQTAKQWPVPQRLTALNLAGLTDFKQLEPSQLLDWAGQYVSGIKASGLFHGGEVEAQQTLLSFLGERYHGYHWKLSRPYLAQRGATSQLSPHIAFGTISTRQVWASATKLQQRLKQDKPSEVRTVEAFISRLRWRDSFTQRLLLFPELIWQNRFHEFDVLYRDEPLAGKSAEYFEAWKAGRTGFPLLDASMKQLAHDGWLNFRMRAQAVTMLCIIFGVSWHHGARYFMQQLVDGDVAINHWQWQMQAGITNPLSLSFRIYSPDKNLVERDPKLAYIHHWLPEFRPYMTPQEILARSRPIVDFQAAKLEHGSKVSAIRRQVRDRLYKENGRELLEARQLQQAASRHDPKRHKKPVGKPVKLAVGQLPLFEAGDG